MSSKRKTSATDSRGPFQGSVILIVALTGGIAVGKSIVASVWKNLGVFVHGADETAHELMAEGGDAYHQILDRFGPRVLAPDRSIDRRILGGIVFSSPADRLWLNRLMHPLVLEKKAAVIRELERRGSHRIFASEAALTVEAGMTPFFDRMVVVHCRPDIQMSRLMARDGIGEEEARRRVSSQLPQDDKIRAAHYTIDTSDSLNSTVEQAERVFRFLDRDWETKAAGRPESAL